MSLNAAQLSTINQNLTTDRAIKSQFLSNPAFTGNTGISPYLSASTLGGVGLDTLASMGVTGLGGSTEQQVQDQLTKTNDLFNLGLSMSAPGSLVQSLTQKAIASSQQQTQSSLQQLALQQQQLGQQIALKQQYGLPITQQEQLALIQLQQQMQQVLVQQQSFQANFLGGLGASSAGAAPSAAGVDLSTLGMGLQGSPLASGFNTGVLSSAGLNSVAAPTTSSLANVFGGLGTGTGYGGVPLYQVAQQQQPQYVVVIPAGYQQQQAVYAQQSPYMQTMYPQQGQRPGVMMLPPVILQPR